MVDRTSDATEDLILVASPIVRIVGRLHAKPLLLDCPTARTVVARPIFQVNGHLYETIAYGDVARRLAAIRPTTALHVEGRLLVCRDSRKRSVEPKLSVEVTRIVSCPPSPKVYLRSS